MREEIVEIEAEGEREALDVGDEVFQRELRKAESLSRRSASESRGVRSWAPDGQMRRIQVKETKTSCMVKCGTTGSSVARGSGHQSIIPRRLFWEEEGESQATFAEGSRATHPEETLGLPCSTEDTEEGRRNRIEAWITDATTQAADWKDGEEPEATSQGQDVRLREPKQASSHVPSASQKGSDVNSVSRKMERNPGQESRETSKVAESSVASRRRNVMSVDLHPRKRPSEASEMIEGSLFSRRRSGESTDVRSGRTPRSTPPRKERIDTAYRRWEEPNFTHRPARNFSPVPQEEMSLTDYADLPPTTQCERDFPPTTQYERKSDRESPFTRTRTRPGPPLSPLRENEDFRENRPSRYSMETPCIHIDPPRAVRSRHDSHQNIEFETPSRAPAAGSYRDANSPRHPSTRVQGTYTETSSMRSARRRPRSPHYKTPRCVEIERNMGPARETTRASGTAENTASNLEALIGVLQAPKVDLPTFKGDPMQYHIFMRAFDNNMERVISDPSSKLARLVQLCTGEAS